ncbi:hypothetical protein SEA_TDANISKY_87 [Mycobacterium phage TDanisky]|uniref:Uncharacterized protein n=1 Tax=Mycobacterium phage Sparkdehlily TaxID=1739966 RepID=A0A0S1S0H9_9CAUD|nr:hypothetical protein SEA_SPARKDEHLILY_86 [Mycobacterium phage Sparkdehlily]ALM02235.1 hypothetical protein SEA_SPARKDEHLILY_86 [Mycobacterium phage Sparkdehlily]QGH71494.1 hypothetical protein SEA_TDANISKY_87 [Mycobacterium phage TDanisky]
MSAGKRCARCGRADDQDGAKADPDCYHLATTLRDPMPDHYDQNAGEEA